jgi:hypothetical protein
MAVVKSLNDNYTITNKLNSAANITLATGTVIIDGNLVVQGTSQTDLNVKDNIITVNFGETGPGVTVNTAGLNVDRGSLADVAVLWDEALGKWTLTNDGTTYQVIQTSTAGAVTSAQVYALVL